MQFLHFQNSYQFFVDLFIERKIDFLELNLYTFDIRIYKYI